MDDAKDRTRVERQFPGGSHELGGGHDVLRFEAVGDIDAEFLILQIPDVSEAGLHREFLSQIFFRLLFP